MDDFMAKFMDGKIDPYGNWGENVGSWLGARRGTENFLVVRYEDLLENTEAELARIADMLGIAADERLLRHAVENSRADRMRQLEQAQRGEHKLLKIERHEYSICPRRQIGAVADRIAAGGGAADRVGLGFGDARAGISRSACYGSRSVTSDGSNTLNDDELAAAVAEPLVAHANLGSHSARGLAYLFAGASATKVIVYVSQLLVLYLVDPKDVGVVTLAGTITSFILLIGQSGVIDVLIHRRAFKQWAIPGFWLALALGLLSCLLIGISAPIAARIFTERPKVAKTIVLAADLVGADAIVLRVGGGAACAAVAAAAVSSVVGGKRRRDLTAEFPYAAFCLVGIRRLQLCFAHYDRRLDLDRRHCGGGCGRLGRRDSACDVGDILSVTPIGSFMSEFGRMLLDQSDYMSLGLFHIDLGLVGIYANGFKFSLQTIRLLMVNMTTILFPAFTKLNDQPQRQYDGFFKAQRILAMVGVSGCLLQAAAADSFRTFVFSAPSGIRRSS